MTKLCSYFTVAFVNIFLVYSEYNETVTKRITGAIYSDADVPDAIIHYSPLKGLKLCIPGRPWYSLINIHGYLNRSRDAQSIRTPPLPKMIDEKITKTDKHGEWVTQFLEYEMDSGDTGYLNIVVYTADDYCYLNEGQQFVVTKLRNNTWITNKLVTKRSQDSANQNLTQNQNPA